MPANGRGGGGQSHKPSGAGSSGSGAGSSGSGAGSNGDYDGDYDGYGATVLCALKFDAQGCLRLKGRELMAPPDLKGAVLPSLFWAAGFSFSRSEVIEEVSEATQQCSRGVRIQCSIRIVLSSAPYVDVGSVRAATLPLLRRGVHHGRSDVDEWMGLLCPSPDDRVPPVGEGGAAILS
jgi:hypothetical protein